ncbi:MAG: DinB family protein [Gemmatimonadales bacterium]
MTTDATMTPYIRETFELLGDREPIAVMVETPGWIADAIGGLSDAALRTPEGADKWSLTQVLAHLADTEIAFGWRARQLLTADNPPLPGFNESAWMTRFDCANADPHQALAAFTALREWNLRVWRMAQPGDYRRTGIHSERGPETLDRTIRMASGHDLRHRRQIERLLRVVA